MNIKQTPLYRMLATDEEIIFVVEDTTIVANNFKVKFIAEVWLSNTGSSPFTQTKIATLKVTPNNAGSGIFDFSRILEAYVSPDYLGGETAVAGGVQKYSQYNTVNFSDTQPHSIHQIDKHSTNRNACKLFGVKFKVEYATTQTGTLTTTSPVLSPFFYIHNAVRQEDDTLAIESSSGFFGYNYQFNNYVLNSASGKFLTNAPTTQYIGLADYCTIGYFNQSDATVGSNNATTLYGDIVGTVSAARRLVKKIVIQFYYNGSTTGSAITHTNSTSNGSLTWQSTSPKSQIQYTGVGTANIIGAGNSLPANWDYYIVKALDDTSTTISDDYYFYNQEVCKGFEKFRLTWLNRLGVWDYFNFTKKNVRKVNSKRETYQQIKGSWNETTYKKHGYKGGTKTFSTNSKEVVTLQTDYITEAAAAWLEELFTSPDVFVLQERSTDSSLGTISNLVNKYIQPCVVTTSSYTKKTTANDKLKQYTIDIEMSHNKRIQKA
tara:strand:- start:4419 stop:5891 length:1473 start_codon:yes stop_codon:yes gene_type:complete